MAQEQKNQDFGAPRPPGHRSTPAIPQEGAGPDSRGAKTDFPCDHQNQNDNAMFRAVLDDDPAAFNRAIGAGANPRQLNALGQSAATLAASEGALKTLPLAVERTGPRGVEGEGQTPAEAAVSRGQREALRLLLGLGLDPKSLARSGEPLAMRAARVGAWGCLEELFEAGAPIGERGRPCASASGQSPLMAAAARGKMEGVDWLIQAGADLDARDHEGATAAMWAARHSRPEALEALILAGANLAIVDRQGLSAADWARLAPCAACLALTERGALGQAAALGSAPSRPKAL